MSEHDRGATGQPGNNGSVEAGQAERTAAAGCQGEGAAAGESSAPPYGQGAVQGQYPTDAAAAYSWAAPGQPAMGLKPGPAGPAMPAGAANPGQPGMAAPGGYAGWAPASGHPVPGPGGAQQMAPGMQVPHAAYYQAPAPQAAYYAPPYLGQQHLPPAYGPMPPPYGTAGFSAVAGSMPQSPGVAAGAAGGQAGRGQAGIAGLMEEIGNGGSGLHSLGKMLNLDDGEFWKGALVGAVAVLLLTNESVQNALFKTGVKTKDAVQTGVDKLKEAASSASGSVKED